MMKDKLIEFETAKLAKEKKFNEVVQAAFTESGKERYVQHRNKWGMRNVFSYSRPSQSILQKWLRESHNLHIGLQVHQFGFGFMYSIIDLKKCECVKLLTGGPNKKFTFEQALEEGLQEALKLVE